MSALLAIAPGFEAPPVQPGFAAGTALQTAAASSTKDAAPVKVPSVFAGIIQELAQEAAPKAVVQATPKTTPRTPQQPAPLRDQPAPESPAQTLRSPAPAPAPGLSAAVAMELPPLPADGSKTGTAQLASAQSPAESTPDAPAAAALSAPPPVPPASSLEGARRQPKSETSGPRESSPRSIPIDATLLMPLAPPISLRAPSLNAHLNEVSGDTARMGDDLRTASPSIGAREQTLELKPAPALELKVRAQDQPAAEQQATPTAIPASKPALADPQTDVELPSNVSAGAQPRAEQIAHALAGAPAPAAMEPTAAPSAQTSAIAFPPTPVNSPQTVNTTPSSPAAPSPQAPAAQLADEPLSRQPEQHAQPLRSLSLEFAPDGAQDVRVRLEERAGDVHISLHSTDPTLSGRLSAGVHELVGTLANAGYDAQGWAHGEGRQSNSEQNQAPTPDDSRRNRRNSAGPGTEDFDALIEQPISNKP